MPKQAVPAAGSGLPKDQPKSCPIAALAREVKTLNDIYNRLDHEVSKLAGDTREATEKRMSALDDQRDWIEEQASHLVTQSGLGAILQIQMIVNDAETMSSWITEGSEGDKRRNEWMQGIERMAYSLVAFIEATTGAKAEDASCDYYMSREHNPHLKITDALAA